MVAALGRTWPCWRGRPLPMTEQGGSARSSAALPCSRLQEGLASGGAGRPSGKRAGPSCATCSTARRRPAATRSAKAERGMGSGGGRPGLHIRSRLQWRAADAGPRPSKNELQAACEAGPAKPAA